jgi:hypothetical protein
VSIVYEATKPISHVAPKVPSPPTSVTFRPKHFGQQTITCKSSRRVHFCWFVLHTGFLRISHSVLVPVHSEESGRLFCRSYFPVFSPYSISWENPPAGICQTNKEGRHKMPRGSEIPRTTVRTTCKALGNQRKADKKRARKTCIHYSHVQLFSEGKFWTRK